MVEAYSFRLALAKVLQLVADDLWMCSPTLHLCRCFPPPSCFLQADCQQLLCALPCPAIPRLFHFAPCLPALPAVQAAGEPAGERGWPEGAPPQVLAGLSAVYSALIQPKFQLKVEFLRGLLKRLRTGSCLVSSGAAEADLRMLAFCAAVVAGLPYRRGDEPCMVVQVRRGLGRLGAAALPHDGRSGAGRQPAQLPERIMVNACPNVN